MVEPAMCVSVLLYTLLLALWILLLASSTSWVVVICFVLVGGKKFGDETNEVAGDKEFTTIQKFNISDLNATRHTHCHVVVVSIPVYCTFCADMTLTVHIGTVGYFVKK